MNDNYNYYIENEYNKAIEFLESEEGKVFIHATFPKYEKLIYNERKTDTFCVYIIRCNHVPIYIGEARRCWGRIAVHLWRMHENPIMYYGLSPEDLKHVSFELDKKRLVIPSERKAMEIELRKAYKSVLNPSELGNNCIPQANRYQEVHRYWNNPDILYEAVKLICIEAPWAFALHEALRRKTACFNYDEMEIPYGLEQRIREMFESRARNEKADLISGLASYLNGSNWITTNNFVKITSRILASYPEFADLKAAVRAMASVQVKRRSQFTEFK